MSGRLWLRSPFDKLRVSGKTCPAASRLGPLQGGEGEEQLLDAGLALEGDDDLIVGAGALAGDDDPLAELRVADVVAGGEDVLGASPFDSLRMSGGVRTIDSASGGYSVALPARPQRRRGGALRRGRQVRRDVGQETRGRVVARERPAERPHQVEMLLGAGHPHVAEPPLLLQLGRVAALQGP